MREDAIGSADRPVLVFRPRRFLANLVGLAVVLVTWVARAESPVAKMAREFAPRVVLHPQERYALANVHHFFANFQLVLDTPFKKYRFRVDAKSIERVTHKGWFRRYTTVDPRWKNHWWFEARDRCEWPSLNFRCDAVYLRARDPIASYAHRVRPEIYWRAVDRESGGRKYTVIQYFFFLLLNDAQNKHDGEWESSVVVVDKATYGAAGADPQARRRAIHQILMAGHYRYQVFPQAKLQASGSSIFVPGTSHYRHVMSLGGHGGYLLVPPEGRHEASMKCFEFVRASNRYYDSWRSPAKLVRVTRTTPWIRYVGRWGRRYGLISALPMKFRFSLSSRFGTCEGRFGLGWLKSRFQVIASAPYGPKFIHHSVWTWSRFPAAPAPTPTRWR